MEEEKFYQITEKNYKAKPYKIIDSTGKLILVENSQKYGYINRKGQDIIPCIYNGITDFSEGYAIARDEDNNCFIYNEEGQIVAKSVMPYQFVSSFHNGYAVVSWYHHYRSSFNYINYEGRELLFVDYNGYGSYDYGSIFKDGYALVEFLGNKVYIIDTKGNAHPEFFAGFKKLYKDYRSINAEDCRYRNGLWLINFTDKDWNRCECYINKEGECFPTTNQKYNEIYEADIPKSEPKLKYEPVDESILERYCCDITYLNQKITLVAYTEEELGFKKEEFYHQLKINLNSFIKREINSKINYQSSRSRRQ